MNPALSPAVSAALSSLAAGKMVLITGDALRGGDIDLVIAARSADASAINFLALHARGLICLALPPERALRMGIALLNSGRERQSGRPFGQSIEAAEGVTTGISAEDRARTSRWPSIRQAAQATWSRPVTSFP
jgi:3,4-dihydroxy 2-butanone 4-phosphate synthase/GTP cyclohydrolase II